MPILPMSLSLFTAQKCALPKRVPSIALCARPMASAFAPSRRSVPSRSPTSSPQSKKIPPQPTNRNYGGRTVRDHLCQIIRQHHLDATLVKSYATDFCGVNTLREATREQVENFVAHLADWAEKDRDALLCQLNSYLGAKEGAA